MVQVNTDFDLSLKLLLNMILHKLLLEELLEGQQELGLLLSDKVDVTELAPAQRLPNLEVVKAPGIVVEGAVRVHF